MLALMMLTAVVLALIRHTAVHLDIGLINTLTGFVIPLVVGLVTHAKAPRWLKSVMNALLSAIAGGLAVALSANGTVQLSTWLVSIAQTFVISVATYYGLWKPSGVAPAVQSASANFGIGGPASDASDTPAKT